MKRIDLHTHPKMSKFFAFDPGAVIRMVGMAKRVGLDGFALTEHFHAPDFWEIHKHLSRTYPNDGGVFWADGLALIPGAEVNIREGAHVVILGEVGEIRRLDVAFPRPLSLGYEPTLREFLDVSDDFELVRIGAHMFRPLKELGKFPAADLQRLHALEVNGRDFGTELMLMAQARALGLPVVSGSDAHHWIQLGVRHTLLHAEEVSIRTLLKTIRGGLTGYGTSSYTAARVRLAKSLKNMTKVLRHCYGRGTLPDLAPRLLAGQFPQAPEHPDSRIRANER